MIKIVKIIFLTFITAMDLRAQSVNSFLLFKNYSTTEGLSSYYSRKITEDRFGFIWIATQDGLNRFNGKRFLVFNKNSEQKIAGNDVTDIVADHQNDLIWVSTALGGINAIDTRTLRIKTTFLVNSDAAANMNDWIVCMALVNNELWIGTDNGMFIYDTRQNKITRQLETPSQIGQRKTARFNKLIVHDDQTVFALVNNTTVAEYSIAEKKLLSSYSVQKGDQVINDIAFFQQDTILAATNSGLISLYSHVSGAKKEIVPVQSSMTSLFPLSNIHCINISKNTLWLATEEGLFKTDPAAGSLIRIKSASEPKGTSFAWEGFINQLFTDSHNELWISATHGIMVSDGLNSPFTSHTSLNNETLRIDHPFSVADNPNGYFLNTDDGLIICDRSFTSGKKFFPGVSFYSCIPMNDVFLLLTSVGLKVFKAGALTDVDRYFSELNIIRSEKIGPWIQLGDSVILLAGYAGQGIWKWNHIKKTVSPVSIKDPSQTQQVNAFYPDTQGSILILCVSNIYRYFPLSGKLSAIQLKKIPKDVILYDIIRKNNSYLVGTYGDGMLVFDSSFNLIKQIERTDGLTNNNIYNFYDLGNDKILAATNFGISVINSKDHSIRSYFEKDGLASNSLEYNFHINSSSQKIFLPSINGVTMVSPDHFSKNPVRASVYFEKVSIKTNSSVRDTINTSLQKIVVPNNFLQVTVSFTGLDYTHSDHLKYFYRIRELADEWVNNEEEDFISLISMSPGTYHLQVKVVNDDGVESEIKELILVFRPKWHQTWWFKLLVVLIMITCGYLLYLIRINQFKKEKKIRSKLASDLHDDLGSTMNSVKVYTNLAMMENQPGKYLPLIKDGTQEAITGIRDIIWVLDDRKDSIEDLLSRINVFASPLCDANDTKYKQELADNARDHKLTQEERRNLYMMMKEAINNAIKYSGCKNLLITIAVTKGKPGIQIKDDGKGFDTTKQGEGNGLKNMQRRAKEIKYLATINSSPGNGTTILFQKI